MKEIIKKCLCLAVLSVNFLHAEDVKLAPDVTEEMLNASYWISRVKNPYKVLVTPEQIQVFNQQITRTWTSTNPSYQMRTDLRTVDIAITGEQIRNQMPHFNLEEKYYIQDSEGKAKEIDTQYWKTIYRRMNAEELGTFEDFSLHFDDEGKIIETSSPNKKEYRIRRALCVKRADAKVYPDETPYSTNPDYWFDDMNQNSAVLMNEPLLVLWEGEKNWYFVKTAAFTGWMKKDTVAFVSDEEFNMYFDYSKNNFLTITENRFSIPESDYFPYQKNEKIPDLFMGTRLFIRDWSDFEYKDYFSPRVPHNCYIAEIPVRKEDGTLGYRHALISSGICSKGFLPYNSANILTLAFKSNGNSYGWGGMKENRDCTAYSGEIFRCFGFDFARNSRAQIEMPGKTYHLSDKSSEEKRAIFKKLPEGTLMGFKGHVFIYIGTVNGKFFAINAAGGYVRDINDPTTLVDAESVHVISLDIARRNKKTFTDACEEVKLLVPEGKNPAISLNKKSKFAEMSKINSGTAQMYYATKNRKNIVVSVNAGHGTKGGTLEKTFCHPDKSPKLIEGSASKGATEAPCVTDGMIFKNGEKEKDINLRTARLLKSKLLSEGYDVLMIRDTEDVQLDNVARVLISNENAAIHVSIHYDSNNDPKSGAFICCPPEELKSLKNVKQNYDETMRLGNCILSGLQEQNVPLYKESHFIQDLTQNSYSTIPSITVELGNMYLDTSLATLDNRAEGIMKGINKYFETK